MVVAVAVTLLAGGTLIALLAAFRLFFARRRVAAALATFGGLFLGTSSLLMPLELSIFASFDNNKPIFDLLEDIFDEPWFLMAWAGLMVMAALPAAMYGLALWFAVPREWERPDDADPDPIRSPPQ